MTRRKKIAVAATVLMALFALLLLTAGFWINWLVKAGIERAGTRALGVATTLDAVDIGIFHEQCDLSGLQIANPEAFTADYFLRLDGGTVDVSVGKLTHHTVEIPQLVLSGVHVNLVRQTGPANFRTILDNIHRFEASREQPDEQAAEERRKKFLIHEVVIKDITVNVDLLPIGGKLTQLNVPIPELRLEEVGSGGVNGESLARVTITILRAVLEAVLTKGESLLPPELLDDLAEKLAEFHPLQNLRERRQERLDSGTPGVLDRIRDRRTQRRRLREEASEPPPPEN